MKIKDLLLKGQSFPQLLKAFSIEAADINIPHEDVIIANRLLHNQEIMKESICIEGKNCDGVVNFFGTLHCNLADNLAVFEMHDFEKTTVVN